MNHLQISLARIDNLVRAAVVRAQANEQGPQDALRGLVVSDTDAESALAVEPMAGLWGESGELQFSLDIPDGGTEDVLFLRLVAAFDLTHLDAFALLFCLAPEFDRRYERVYAYLQDDLSQRRVTVNLLMNLMGGTLAQRFAVWDRLQPGSPLLEYRLLRRIPNPDKPNAAGLADVLSADPRVIAYLLGRSEPDEQIRPALLPRPADSTHCLSEVAYERLCVALGNGPMVFIEGRAGTGQAGTAAALCEPYGLELLRVHGGRLAAPGASFDELWRLVLREGYLNEAALVLEYWDDLLGDDRQPPANFWAALCAYPYPVFLCGAKPWEPLDPDRTRPLLRVKVVVPPFPDRLTAWERHTSAAGIHVGGEALTEVARKFRLTHEQIARAVRSAEDVAASRGGVVDTSDLYAGVQAHISLQLGHLAERIQPRYTWDDLILPPDQLQQLREITDRARFAHRVGVEWGFGQRVPNAAGVSVLFAGDSGTGKTLSAQVIASALGLAMYRIDLSAVVSKYIGETEKNLSVIFAEARSSNAILFFDEADAIFGKRSEVKDARDRYANIEISYLLQQIEDYDGVAIMATNLRQNLDEAFTRRLDFMVDFPFPDEIYRERLWRAHFPPEAPLADDVDMTELAARYRLAGGNIRNAVLASAFLAAADDSVIKLSHLRSAIRREHQKMGRLLEEF